MDDADRMSRALELARSGLGRVWPNPSVGCVIVVGDQVVGEARTQARGRPHAEVVALAQAEARARGATMYVTLEPCSHWGRTPPCCEAILQAGVARVVVAIRDPDPRVNGRGIESLRHAGVQVEVGLAAEQAGAINEGFFTRILTGRPQVVPVEASASGVPDGFDAQLGLTERGWRARVALRRDPDRLEDWFAHRVADGIAMQPGAGSGVDAPPVAMLAALGHEGLTRVAVPDDDPAYQLLVQAGLLP